MTFPKKKKKVLHVVGAMNRAGTETMLMNIYRHIDKKHIQFDFVSYSGNAAHYDQEIESLGGRIIRLTNTNSIIQIYRAIKQYGSYDAIHAHTLFHSGIVSLAGFLAGVKIRISHAHTTSDKSDSFIRKLYILVMRFLINTFSTNFLACSREAGSYLFGEKALNKENYMYFPNAIDYAKFLHAPKKEIQKFKLKNGLRNSSITIGHIGTFKESKNHIFLLEIMEQLVKKDSTISMLLVGDGELKNFIQEKANQKGLSNNIKFLGTSDNIPTILHSMDVFVFPSIYEGLGLVLLEAQASGIPCITSEAIQPEANLGLHLLKKVPLARGPRVWAKEIIRSANKKEKNVAKIIHRFETNGYTLSNGIAILNEIYNSNSGGAYEQGLNRLH